PTSCCHHALSSPLTGPFPRPTPRSCATVRKACRGYPGDVVAGIHSGEKSADGGDARSSQREARRFLHFSFRERDSVPHPRAPAKTATQHLTDEPVGAAELNAGEQRSEERCAGGVRGK